jgi:hypothetical protein
MLQLTYECNIDVFKTGIVCCGYCDGPFESVHGGIGRNPGVARSISAVEVDLNGRLTVMGNVANLGPNLIPHGLHCDGMRVLGRWC